MQWKRAGLGFIDKCQTASQAWRRQCCSAPAPLLVTASVDRLVLRQRLAMATIMSLRGRNVTARIMLNRRAHFENLQARFWSSPYAGHEVDVSKM